MAERDYEWDDDKRAANLAKHGLDFAAANRFDWDSAVIVEDTRRDYGERRLRAYGWLDGRICALVFTTRQQIVRVISLRPVRKRELKRYGL